MPAIFDGSNPGLIEAMTHPEFCDSYASVQIAQDEALDCGSRALLIISSSSKFVVFTQSLCSVTYKVSFPLIRVLWRVPRRTRSTRLFAFP
jgi:hypothetical protein